MLELQENSLKLIHFPGKMYVYHEICETSFNTTNSCLIYAIFVINEIKYKLPVTEFFKLKNNIIYNQSSSVKDRKNIFLSIYFNLF